MSRASAYRAAATDLRRASVHFSEVAAAHRRTEATVIGAVGGFAAIHDRSIDVVGRHLAVAADGAAQLAAVCDRRAAVCEEYERRVASWRALPWLERGTVPCPLPSAHWVLG